MNENLIKLLKSKRTLCYRGCDDRNRGEFISMCTNVNIPNQMNKFHLLPNKELLCAKIKKLHNERTKEGFLRFIKNIDGVIKVNFININFHMFETIVKHSFTDLLKETPISNFTKHIIQVINQRSKTDGITKTFIKWIYSSFDDINVTKAINYDLNELCVRNNDITQTEQFRMRFEPQKMQINDHTNTDLKNKNEIVISDDHSKRRELNYDPNETFKRELGIESMGIEINRFSFSINNIEKENCKPNRKTEKQIHNDNNKNNNNKNNKNDNNNNANILKKKENESSSHTTNKNIKNIYDPVII